ncbi:hypothetical protein H8356DRAFT_1276446 [Neocallimastix lanati (nom. inval.)]|nr:hypothetical protein H8356DRAFT_1276446 [Neocallimastix sp. JGI-2020a]
MVILVVFVEICFFIEIIWKFPISDSVNLIFVFFMSSFKSLNVFSTYRNVNEYAILTHFNSSKEYKNFVYLLSSGLLCDFASLLYSINNELRLS